tara:strand:- start:5875 stop:6393 length:519 start_codon:yes stop_codon:yes gene_type:complete
MERADLKTIVSALVDLINDFTNSGFDLECCEDDGDVFVDGGEDVGDFGGLAAINFMSGAIATRKKLQNIGFSTHFDILITRHLSFTEYLREIGFSWGQEKEHASPGECEGKTVLTSGMPLHLAMKCKHLVTVPLDIPPNLRGLELGLDQIKLFAGSPQWFKVLGGEFPPQQI